MPKPYPKEFRNDVVRVTRLLEQENEVLRQAAAYLGQANLPKRMMYPLVRELAVDGIPATVSCRVLELARSAYDRWLDEPIAGAVGRPHLRPIHPN